MIKNWKNTSGKYNWTYKLETKTGNLADEPGKLL